MNGSAPEREIHDCGIPNLLEGERAGARLVAGTDMLVVTALEPLRSEDLRLDLCEPYE